MRRVLAKDMAQAIEYLNRFAKKSYYQTVEILNISLEVKIDIIYKK